MSAITDRFFNYFYDEQAKEYITSSEKLEKREYRSLREEEATEDGLCFLRTPLKYIFQLDQKNNYGFVFFPLTKKIIKIISTDCKTYRESKPYKEPGSLEHSKTSVSSDDIKIVEGEIGCDCNRKKIHSANSNVTSDIIAACAFMTRMVALSVVLAVVTPFELIKTMPLFFIYSTGFAGSEILSTFFSCSPRKQEELTAAKPEEIAGKDSTSQEDNSPYSLFSSTLPTEKEDESSNSYSIFASSWPLPSDPEEEVRYEQLSTEESAGKNSSLFSCFTNLNPFSSQNQHKIEAPELELEEVFSDEESEKRVATVEIKRSEREFEKKEPVENSAKPDEVDDLFGGACVGRPSSISNTKPTILDALVWKKTEDGLIIIGGDNEEGQYAITINEAQVTLTTRSRQVIIKKQLV